MRILILACLLLLSACGRDTRTGTSSASINECSTSNGRTICTRIGR